MPSSNLEPVFNWVPRYNTWLLIELKPTDVVLSGLFFSVLQVQADSGAKSVSVRRTSGRTASKGTGGGGGAGPGAPPALSTRSRKSSVSADLSKVILFHRRRHALFNPKTSISIQKRRPYTGNL